MRRYLEKSIKESLSRKMVMLSGPRQSGKTTLARSLEKEHVYLNWDTLEDRTIILERAWSRREPLIVFDELHKMPQWKSWLKGVWDDSRRTQQIIVTGSARLDTFRRAGDSLAGRYFNFHLHPFDMRELEINSYALERSERLKRLLTVGGFPEPFIDGEHGYYNRWKVGHLDAILRQDLIDLEIVTNINKLETLVALLAKCVGSPISYNALAEDIGVSDGSIKRWIALLEELYVIFRVSPLSRNVSRSLLKAQKIYFYDNARVNGDEGAVFENAVACALMKEVDRANDCEGAKVSLHYVRDKDGHEIDFVLSKVDIPFLAVEAKVSDETPAPAIKRFCPMLDISKAVQVVQNNTREKSYDFGLDIVSAERWLSEFSL